jgi:hypothetical protein
LISNSNIQTKIANAKYKMVTYIDHYPTEKPVENDNKSECRKSDLTSGNGIAPVVTSTHSSASREDLGMVGDSRLEITVMKVDQGDRLPHSHAPAAMVELMLER